jgi:hypothetical protein
VSKVLPQTQFDSGADLQGLGFCRRVADDGGAEDFGQVVDGHFRGWRLGNAHEVQDEEGEGVSANESREIKITF